MPSYLSRTAFKFNGALFIPAGGKQSGKSIFKTVHRLFAVGDRNPGLVSSLGIFAYKGSGFVINSEQPPHIRDFAQTRLKVVFVKAVQSDIKVIRVEDLSQPADVGMPLSEKLIDRAAVSDLIFYLAFFGIPVGVGAAVFFKNRFVGKIDFLDIVAAVTEIFIRPLRALCENVEIFGGFFFKSQI